MSNITEEQFRYLLNADSEHEHLEFKEAKENFNFENGTHSLLGYCIGIANEGGGKLILGVTDAPPRKVIGTKAFPDIQKTHENIFHQLKRRVEIQELFFDGKRVLIFNIFSRPIAEPLDYNGQFLMRVGERLEPMTSSQLRRIYSEGIADYSEKTSKKISMESFDPKALRELRRLLKISGRTKKNVDDLNDEQLLRDLELLKDDFTLASVILLGTEHGLSNVLPFAEIRYGYKLNESEIRNQDTQIFHKGYLLYHNTIWKKINSRNINLSIPQGMVIIEKKAFEEQTVREAVCQVPQK